MTFQDLYPVIYDNLPSYPYDNDHWSYIVQQTGEVTTVSQLLNAVEDK